MTKENKVVIIFGFSGSGKSTLANRVGKEFGLRVVHPSGILRDLYEGKEVDLQNTKYNTGFWENQEGIELFKSRLHEREPLDVISDRILLNEVKKSNVVIDSWSLPWLTDTGYKVYLEADLETRAERVAKRSAISYTRALDVIAMKDRETRKLFKRIYGFDIVRDHGVFDLTIDTADLTQEQVFLKVHDYLCSNGYSKKTSKQP